MNIRKGELCVKGVLAQGFSTISWVCLGTFSRGFREFSGSKWRGCVFKDWGRLGGYTSVNSYYIHSGDRLQISKDVYTKGMAKLVDAVHLEGSKAALQIAHSIQGLALPPEKSFHATGPSPSSREWPLYGCPFRPRFGR